MIMRAGHDTGARQPRILPPPPEPEHPETEMEMAGLPPQRRHLARGARGPRWGRVLFSCLAGLALLAVTIWTVTFIETLFARDDWLGWLALALGGLAALAVLAIIVREALALIRLGRITSIRQRAEETLVHDDDAGAAQTLEALRALYRPRRDMRWALADLSRHDGEIIDPGNRIRLAERTLMADLDAEAALIIAGAARRVSVITALLPAAALDVATVAIQNLVMLRRLATLYGGRPGSLGTMKLARMVVTHLAVTGGLALSDSLVQHVVGRGIAGRLSARVGEGAVNGILTARVGLAALDLVRPLPFSALDRPSLTAIAARVTGRGG